jgi:hypothetical protein
MNAHLAPALVVIITVGILLAIAVLAERPVPARTLARQPATRRSRGTRGHRPGRRSCS